MWHVNQIDILYRISGFNCIYMYESIIDTSVDKCYNHHNLTCMICLWFFCNSIVYIVMKSLKRLRPGTLQLENISVPWSLSSNKYLLYEVCCTSSTNSYFLFVHCISLSLPLCRSSSCHQLGNSECVMFKQDVGCMQEYANGVYRTLKM